MASHLDLLKSKLLKRNLDALLIRCDANISYLTSYESSDSYLLVSGKQNIYFTDSRNFEAAKINLKNRAAVKKTAAFKEIAGACLKLGLKRIGFEEKKLTLYEYKKLKEQLDKTARLTPASGLIEELRQIKSADELLKIEEAARITVSALRLIKDFIRPGKKEIEVAAELERFIRYRGASGSAFRIIVASGPNSSFPHHITSQRALKTGECVLIDAGIDYCGYKSDLTRVFFLGKIPLYFRKIYDIVLRAQEKAIKKIKPGISISSIDCVARQYIKEKGYGGFFGHSLGHGIGREIHEEPCISAKEKNTLKKGMVFTIEPGIYLPRKFGVRIEDMVVVTKSGARIISESLSK